MGSNDMMFQCKDNRLTENCYSNEEIEKAIDYIKDVYSQLSRMKGEVICETAKPGEDVMKINVLRTRIYIDSDENKMDNPQRLFDCCVRHIMANPHWNIRALMIDGSEAPSWEDVAALKSTVANMGFWCRLSRSLTQVVYGIFLCCCMIGCSVLLIMYIKHRVKRNELEQKDVYAMVEKIIDILQEHQEQHKSHDSDEPPYLAIQHVRDQLLPPAQRRQYQHIWDKAVEFIAANESRIRLETKVIRGEEFDVWHWLQPAAHNGKVWQGQAFGENDTANQIIYCPSPCLKIRNMFDSNMENDDDWEEGVVDAVLEKCRAIESILHIYVDVDSKEGCVYMKCSSCEAAGKARTALNGWWFDGRLVTVKHLKTDHYHKRWPESRTVISPLKPSTNQMRSLSQPFYRSSLETT